MDQVWIDVYWKLIYRVCLTLFQISFSPVQAGRSWWNWPIWDCPVLENLPSPTKCCSGKEWEKFWWVYLCSCWLLLNGQLKWKDRLARRRVCPRSWGQRWKTTISPARGERARFWVEGWEIWLRVLIRTLINWEEEKNTSSLKLETINANRIVRFVIKGQMLR